MNDYTMGALEALSWARKIFAKKGLEKEIKIIDSRINLILEGVTYNFKRKLEEISITSEQSG